MIRIVKEPLVKCNNCEKQYSITEEDFGEPEIFAQEGKLGIDRHVKWSKAFECEDCENYLEISLEGYEYSEGSLSEASCVVVEEPILESLIQE